ncbi:MAG: site-specific recombinase, partial [Zoogloeaceae bacterium]|nr:site-specific recombinase [Zoogloeaceae bacterium]
MERNLETVISGFLDPHRDPVALLGELVIHIRPKGRGSRPGDAEDALRALTRLLQAHPDGREAMAAAVLGLLNRTRHVSLYVSAGIFPPTGFFSETAHRLGCTLLPEVVDRDSLKDILGLVFSDRTDHQWVSAIDEGIWQDLADTLFPPPLPFGSTLPRVLEELVDALRVLSYHVSAIGLDPELVRVLASLEDYDSPFIAQNVEMIAHLTRYLDAWSNDEAPEEDDRHLRVLLDQCRDVMRKIRRRASQQGTSLSLTFKLERLDQNLRRIDDLLAILAADPRQLSVQGLPPGWVPLFKNLVEGQCRKNDLGFYLRRNIELLSLRVTENASRTGEHYITESRWEYFALVRSAMGAGAIIAFMAGIKLAIGHQGMAPLNEALASSLNYGLGFVLIHLLHFTVATKQPAMTANAIAASIDEVGERTRNLERLVDLIVRTIRSQLGAIFGNVVVAVPLAMFFALALASMNGQHFITPEKAAALLGGVDPLSGAPFYAATAGVCLFLSGLVAGYYDNLAAYERIPERLRQVRWARRLFGARRLQSMAAYVGDNLGALAGNLLFGFMLGGVTALGVLFGLPLDIRHIAFAAAHSGYAVVALDFKLAAPLVGMTAAGVATIGLVNLAVSFSLALLVALRARRVSFAQGWTLGWLVLRRFFRRPWSFLWPPADETVPPHRPGDTGGR